MTYDVGLPHLTQRLQSLAICEGFDRLRISLTDQKERRGGRLHIPCFRFRQEPAVDLDSRALVHCQELRASHGGRRDIFGPAILKYQPPLTYDVVPMRIFFRPDAPTLRHRRTRRQPAPRYDPGRRQASDVLAMRHALPVKS